MFSLMVSNFLKVSVRLKFNKFYQEKNSYVFYLKIIIGFGSLIFFYKIMK